MGESSLRINVLRDLAYRQGQVYGLRSDYSGSLARNRVPPPLSQPQGRLHRDDREIQKVIPFCGERVAHDRAIHVGGDNAVGLHQAQLAVIFLHQLENYMEHHQSNMPSAHNRGIDGHGQTDGSRLTSLRATGLRWTGATKSAARQADTYLHAHPWLIAGAVAAASAAAGYAYSRLTAKRKV